MDNDQLAQHRLTGFAVLTVDWNIRRRSYVDNFLNYVMAALGAKQNEALNSHDVTDILSQEYGIRLPERVVNKVLNRSRRLGLTEKKGQELYKATNKGDKELSKISPQIDTLKRQQQDLANAFVDWAQKEIDLKLKTEEATKAIIEYVETYYGSILSMAQGSGSIGSLPSVEPTQMQRLTASFIDHVSHSDAQRFNYLVNVAQGSMLLSSLFAPAPVNMEKQFKNTTVLLDTKIIFRALGYEGSRAKAATLDWIKLLEAQNAKVSVFEFTLTEARSVIRYCIRAYTQGTLWRESPGSVGAHFFESDTSLTEMELQEGTVESRLSEINIETVPNPEYDERYVIDEEKLSEVMLTSSQYYKPAALEHDTKALAAIIRMRRGRAMDSLEECRAVFVTTNSRIIRAARKVEDLRNEPWYVAMLDTDIATLAWIKSPPSAPDLPRETVLATCLGVLRPGPEIWSSYVRELEKLHAISEISDSELVLLRLKYEKDNLAFVGIKDARGEGFEAELSMSVREARSEMEATIAAPFRDAALSAEHKEQEIQSFLNKVQRDAQEYRVTADTAKSAADAAQQAAEEARTLAIDLSQQNKTLQERIISSARSSSRNLGMSVNFVIFIALALLALGAISWRDDPKFASKAWQIAFNITLTINIALGGLQLFSRKVGRIMETWYYNRRLKKLGIIDTLDESPQQA